MPSAVPERQLEQDAAGDCSTVRSGEELLKYRRCCRSRRIVAAETESRLAAWSIPTLPFSESISRMVVHRSAARTLIYVNRGALGARRWYRIPLSPATLAQSRAEVGLLAADQDAGRAASDLSTAARWKPSYMNSLASEIRVTSSRWWDGGPRCRASVRWNDGGRTRGGRARSGSRASRHAPQSPTDTRKLGPMRRDCCLCPGEVVVLGPEEVVGELFGLVQRPGRTVDHERLHELAPAALEGRLHDRLSPPSRIGARQGPRPELKAEGGWASGLRPAGVVETAGDSTIASSGRFGS